MTINEAYKTLACSIVKSIYDDLRKTKREIDRITLIKQLEYWCNYLGIDYTAILERSNKWREEHIKK